MLAWASERVDTLPNRCMQLVFGDINDDVGMQRKGGRECPVDSVSVGDERRGLETFAGRKFCNFCETQMLGVCSTYWHTSSTYRGNESNSYIDTWALPISHITKVHAYKTMPKIAAKLQVGNQWDEKKT